MNPTEPEIPALREVLDQYLFEQTVRGQKIQSVETVANTIFPKARYHDPGLTWVKKGDEAEAALDQAANRLFTSYSKNYDLLKKLSRANQRGTYFGRLMAWETADGPINQLHDRIKSLRSARGSGKSRWNVNDLSVAGEAEAAHQDATDLFDVDGLQMYRPTDHVGYLSRGFPCMVHIDLTVYENKLHLLAVYRHQLLITKGYGNLVGLGRLHRFLAQQTGYELGELSMQAGMSDAEWEGTWTKTGSSLILALSEAAVQ
jgi:thymidylate synthase